MITTLNIKNIGIIDDISINLNKGFNVLTGETGAGKTLIIGSLQILSGGRFSKEMIRKGEKTSFVEMSLYLPGKGFEDDTVVVSREINVSGKNISKINGRLVSVSELRSFMNEVIDIHGQNDNQSILDPLTHIRIIDEYANSEIKNKKEEYRKVYEEYLKIKAELSNNYGDDKEKERKLDLLNYQLSEIEEAKLKKDEDIELESRRNILSSYEKISENLILAESEINNNVLDSVNVTIRALEKIESYSNDYKEILERIKSSYYEIEEVGRDLENSKQETNFDEEELNQIEERLNIIKSLKRKYGNSIEEILDYKNKIKTEIFEIENLEEYIKKLKKDLKEKEEKLYKISLILNEIRKKYALDLSKKINENLKELEMKNAIFEVNINFNEEKKFNKDGLDEIQFLISTNIGEELKPLVKIASGGEMSRIMLAIKNVLGDSDKIPVLIFDEIDTGISGIAANKTGDKIKNISKTHQVICVTHLASIAAKGDNNYYIYKESNENQTKTKVKQLSEEETVKEIARIASGNITEISINHAKELRKQNEKIA
ncbi:MAG: DNA repair protein RecN [Clostridia bacterium]|nr:DNA repair protein RecN [Clostridia bacterium]